MNIYLLLPSGMHLASVSPAGPQSVVVVVCVSNVPWSLVLVLLWFCLCLPVGRVGEGVRSLSAFSLASGRPLFAYWYWILVLALLLLVYDSTLYLYGLRGITI